MPRRFLHRWLSGPRAVRARRGLHVFGARLHDRELWRLTRRSTARAVALGLFCAMVPLPFQMALAAAVSIYVGCNVPIAVAMCWATNPLTFAPVFFAAYKLGAWLLGLPPGAVRFEMSVDWFVTTFTDIWLPLLAGSAAIGLAAALAGFYGTHLLWRLAVVRRRRRPYDRRT